MMFSLLAKELGMNAKFTGSGGALLCIRVNSSDWFSEDKERQIKHRFLEHGFEFVRILIPNI